MPAALLAVFLSGCASIDRAPPPQPASADSTLAVVGVSIKARTIDPFANRADAAYFAPLRGEELDLDHQIRSSKSAGGWVYAFNLPKGRYAPVAFTYQSRAKRYLARLEPATSKAWAFDAAPGKVVFVGDNFLRREGVGWGQAVLNALKTLKVLVPPFRRATVSLPISAPRLDRGTLLEARALRSARETLRETAWTDWLDARLRELGDPPEPIRTGRFRKRLVPHQRTERFLYQDTVGWGKPAAVRGGLEWREPKGRARIAAVFLKAGDPGHKPLGEYLLDLKQAGSPEDAHAVVPVTYFPRPAWAAVYTLYEYPQPYLVGSRVRVLVTETVVAEDPEGLYVLRVRAEKDHFAEARARFRRFLSYLILTAPKKEEGT